HLSAGAIKTSLTTPGALEPLIVSLQSGAVTLGVLVLLGTQLAWLLARGKLSFPRIWEAGILCTLLMPPLVIGLLLIFLVGPYTPIGEWLGTLHLSATNTFLALVIAQVYESAPITCWARWPRSAAWTREWNSRPRCSATGRRGWCGG